MNTLPYVLSGVLTLPPLVAEEFAHWSQVDLLRIVANPDASGSLARTAA